MEKKEFKYGNSESEKLDLYIPEESNGILLIYFHGGGLEAGDKNDEHEIYEELVERGYVIVSANYRMYPQAKYPDYLEDAARAVAWSLNNVKDYVSYEKVYVGGISAGSYISQMLHFNKKLLSDCNIDERCIDGYIFDAGQPTVHFNVLRERGMDTGAVRIDETASLYYVYGEHKGNLEQRYLIMVSDNDIPGRKEQNELLIATMKSHGYKAENIVYKIISGFGHAGYVHEMSNVNVDGQEIHGYTKLLLDFLQHN